MVPSPPQNPIVPPAVSALRAAKDWKALRKLNLNERLKLLQFLGTSSPQKPISTSISYPSPNLSCPICMNSEESLEPLFFFCPFARIIWKESFPLDTQLLGINSIVEWIKIILDPGNLLNLPRLEVHLFQIFASMPVI
ncbi:hypothetical protein SLA2020_439580 [Shorea laevis]